MNSPRTSATLLHQHGNRVDRGGVWRPVYRSMHPRFRALVVLCLLVPALRLGSSGEEPGFYPDISTASGSVINFNEIMYHPAEPEDSLEWIELHNPMAADMDLAGWRIEGGIDYTFPSNVVLRAGGYLVVAADPGSLPVQAGSGPVFGPFVRRLSNADDTLALRNHNGRLMDELAYSDDAPWPIAADGSGGSLAKLRRFAASSPAENWTVSARAGGTPGRANFENGLEPAPRHLRWVTRVSEARWIVPSGPVEAGWTAPGFDDSGWNEGTAAPGFYEAGSDPGVVPVARAYSFDGNFEDGSGNGLDAENFGTAFSANYPPVMKGGQSLRLNGTGAHVVIADPVSPDSYTLSIWVLLLEVRPCSLILRTDKRGPRGGWSHQLRVGSSGRFEHYVFDGTQKLVTGTEQIQPGVWYHLAGTASSGGEMRLFVNGVESGEAQTIGNLWAGGNQWRLGTDSGHTEHFLRGALDSAGIWHVELAGAQIEALALGSEPSLLNGYLPLITTVVREAMLGHGTSLFLRVPFTVEPDLFLESITLNIRYDDGFVAWLNGTEIARRNAPGTVEWISAAASERPAREVIQLETIDLSERADELRAGENVLAFQVLNASAEDPDLLLAAELSGREAELPAHSGEIHFSEIGGVGGGFFLELVNRGEAAAQLEGYRVRPGAGTAYSFEETELGPGGLLVLTTNELGFSPTPGGKLFLFGPNGSIRDSAEVQARGQGRRPGEDRWLYVSAATPGENNAFELNDNIVINEIMYHHPPEYPPGSTSNPVENHEQWIELYNRGDSRVDLSGWRFTRAIDYIFPNGTGIEPGGYLVLAKDSSLLREKYPDIEIIGNFQRNLSHRADHIILLDANGNPADEVRYYDGFPWPAYADGGGSSLELTDPRNDNSVPGAWAASLEGPKAPWRRYTYRAVAVNPLFSPPTSFFREFRMGLLDSGEALVDNVSVVELAPDGSGRQFLQNTNFTDGTKAWRLLGNHSDSRAQDNPDAPGNQVLRLVAGGPMSYMDNRVETTFKIGNNYVGARPGREYEISFDAKWLGGSPQLHAEIYYNKVTTTQILELPEKLGTPGKPNSTLAPNAGPAYKRLSHAPVIPGANESIQVQVSAEDLDGISRLTLHYAVNGGSWRMAPMSGGGGGSWRGTIPGQSASAVIQFYIRGEDELGAISMHPREGPESRALIKVTEPQSGGERQTFRIIMTPGDSGLMHGRLNLMSDDLLGCTIIHEEEEVFYNARIRLHGSMFSRDSASTTGFTVKFPRDHLFRGSRASVVVRRSGMTESFLKFLMNKAGGLPANYDDIVYLVSHRSDNRGPARLNMAHYDDTFISSQFENDEGTNFKFEGIRIFQATDNGSPEGRKLPHPVDFAWNYDLTDLGDDKEQYRWSIMIGNKRARDDYSPVIRMGKAFSLSGGAMKSAIAEAIDVDQWARYFAIQNLFGIADIYGVDNPHNVAFYARPEDGRMVILQNDWGFPFALGTGASIYGQNNVYEMLRLPGYRRLYHGHLLQLSQALSEPGYVGRWANHFSRLTGENLSGAAHYIEARGATIRRQIGAPRVFEILSNGGEPIAVETPEVRLAGRGWVDVREIRLRGEPEPLALEWLDDFQWRVEVPLRLGENQIELAAYNSNGTLVGEDAITVTTSASGYLARDYLRVSELMYHPAEPSPAEVAAGYIDKNGFEFAELVNIGPAAIPLEGVKFTEGVQFDFTGAWIGTLPPGGRVLIVNDQNAFEFRYGPGLPVAGQYDGQLDNAGERIRLENSFGNVIQEFTYGDGSPWPSEADGAGPSLEALNLEADPSAPENWRASQAPGGSPGGEQARALTVGPIHFADGRIEITLEAEADAGYTVWSSPDLAAGEWTVLETIPPGEARTEIIRDEPAPEDRQRYYRVSSP